MSEVAPERFVVGRSLQLPIAGARHECAPLASRLSAFALASTPPVVPLRTRTLLPEVDLSSLLPIEPLEAFPGSADAPHRLDSRLRSSRDLSGLPSAMDASIATETAPATDTRGTLQLEYAPEQVRALQPMDRTESEMFGMRTPHASDLPGLTQITPISTRGSVAEISVVAHSPAAKQDVTAVTSREVVRNVDVVQGPSTIERLERISREAPAESDRTEASELATASEVRRSTTERHETIRIIEQQDVPREDRAPRSVEMRSSVEPMGVGVARAGALPQMPHASPGASALEQLAQLPPSGQQETVRIGSVNVVVRSNAPASPARAAPVLSAPPPATPITARAAYRNPWLTRRRYE